MTWQEAVERWQAQMRSDYTRHSFGVPVRLFFEKETGIWDERQ